MAWRLASRLFEKVEKVHLIHIRNVLNQDCVWRPWIIQKHIQVRAPLSWVDALDHSIDDTALAENP
jgi:hypothetical protein